ncbi:hypothetical protein AB0A69_02985 [Streptomyces sp. NPDC045431]|uniref:tryptophan biosynthesis modulator TrpM n=1 Tax=Streptomyces sp. NPDC045431 TaxID=3155613 RepID=UPI0033EB88FB
MTAAARALAPNPHPAPSRPVPSADGACARAAGRTAPSTASHTASHTASATAVTRACVGAGVGAGSPTAGRPRRPYAPGLAAGPYALPDAYARLARGCRPRGCRAPARRVHGRRVRYVIGDEPGQVNGMRWRARTARPHHR